MRFLLLLDAFIVVIASLDVACTYWWSLLFFFFADVLVVYICRFFVGATVVIAVTAVAVVPALATIFPSMLIQPAGCSFSGPVSTDRPEMDAHWSFVAV